MEGKLNILLVDDEPLIITSAFHYFCQRGCNVVATCSSQAAMSLINSEMFDVVITDFMMQPFTGADIIRHLREKGFGGKIILISASALCDLNKTVMKELQIDAFFEKPFSISEIHNTIKKWEEPGRTTEMRE